MTEVLKEKRKNKQALQIYSSTIQRRQSHLMVSSQAGITWLLTCCFHRIYTPVRPEEEYLFSKIMPNNSLDSNRINPMLLSLYDRVEVWWVLVKYLPTCIAAIIIRHYGLRGFVLIACYTFSNIGVYCRDQRNLQNVLKVCLIRKSSKHLPHQPNIW